MVYKIKMSNNTTTTETDTYHAGLGLVLIMLTIIVFTILIARNLVEQEIHRSERIKALRKAIAVAQRQQAAKSYV